VANRHQGRTGQLRSLHADRATQERYPMTVAYRTPFAGICHTLRSWCAANGAKYILVHVYPEWAEASVSVDGDTWLVGAGLTTDGVLAVLDRSLATHRNFMADKRRREWRVIDGGRV
jgi:hypothetical protein